MLVCFVSCRKHTTPVCSTSVFLQNLSLDKKLYPYDVSDDSLLNSTIENKIDSTYCGIVYFADGSCSMCIAKLVSFLFQKDSMNCASLTTVMVCEEDALTFRYYVEDVIRNKSTQIVPVEKENFAALMRRDDINGLCVEISNGRITRAYLYIE